MTELQVKKIGKVYEIALDERPIRVGRSSSNDIVLRSERVSREHCVIELVDGAPRLRDLQSRHGTRVNGRKVTETPIRPGDRIGVGGYEISFDGLAGSIATSATPATPVSGTADTADTTDTGDGDALERAAQEERLDERGRALADEARRLDEERDALEADRAALAGDRASLDDDRASLDDDRASLDDDRAALDEERAAFDRTREDLTARAADLERRERELAEERERIASGNRVLTERDEERGREIERMTAEVAGAVAAAEAEKSRAGRLADEIASLQAALETAQRETRSVSDRLSEAEADNDSVRKQAAHLSRQLERKSKDLTKTIDRAAALETALARAEAARQVLGAQAGKAEALEVAARAVVAASDYLALVRQSVNGIEEQWLESDEIVDESTELGEVDSFQVMQREQLGRQLEIAHEARENAMTELQETVTRLSEAIARGRRVPQRNLLSQ